MLIFTWCSFAPKGETATVADVQKEVSGGIIIETFKMTATVTGIDATPKGHAHLSRPDQDLV